jgi:hypothetical protein
VAKRRENKRVIEKGWERSEGERGGGGMERGCEQSVCVLCCESATIWSVSRTFRKCAPGFPPYISTGNQVHIRIFGTRTWYCRKVQYSIVL